MSFILSFVNPLEFLLRYTVIAGVLVAAIGVAICLTAKRVVMAKRRTTTIDRKDGLYTTLMLLGLGLLLVGMIIMVLPIEATFYVV
jgi:hypothetical protein